MRDFPALQFAGGGQGVFTQVVGLASSLSFLAHNASYVPQLESEAPGVQEPKVRAKFP